MLEFLMYKLEDILPDDQFYKTIDDFRTEEAQAWLNRVKGLIGISCYENIKAEYRASGAGDKRKRTGDVDCSAKRKGCKRNGTVGQQTDIGADRNPEVDAIGVDNLFDGIFVGI